MKWTGKLVSFVPQNKFNVEVSIEEKSRGHLAFNYRIEGSLAGVELPPPQKFVSLGAGSELWKKTCFECFFFNEQSSDYYELNVSAEGSYDVMSFKNYRESPERDARKFMEISNLLVDQDQSSYRVSFNIKVLFHGSYKVSPALILDDQESPQLFFAATHASAKADFHSLKAVQNLTPTFLI